MAFNQDGPSRLMRCTSGRPVSIFVLVALVIQIWIAMREGYLLLAERPDLSCDGVFNFADPPPAVYALVTAVGDNVRSTVLRMRRAEIAQFLQISADPPNPFWPAALSAFFYYLLYLFKQKSLRKPKQQNERLKK